MKKVLILDQFCGITPYKLQQEPMKWLDLVKLVEDNPDHFKRFSFSAAPRVSEVTEDYLPQMATTVFCEDENGMVKVWKHHWDTSG